MSDLRTLSIIALCIDFCEPPVLAFPALSALIKEKRSNNSGDQSCTSIAKRTLIRRLQRWSFSEVVSKRPYESTGSKRNISRKFSLSRSKDAHPPPMEMCPMTWTELHLPIQKM